MLDIFRGVDAGTLTDGIVELAVPQRHRRPRDRRRPPPICCGRSVSAFRTEASSTPNASTTPDDGPVPAGLARPRAQLVGSYLVANRCSRSVDVPVERDVSVVVGADWQGVRRRRVRHARAGRPRPRPPPCRRRTTDHHDNRGRRGQTVIDNHHGRAPRLRDVPADARRDHRHRLRIRRAHDRGCFAHLGHDVSCADIDRDRVELLNRGEVPILEAGLENLDPRRRQRRAAEVRRRLGRAGGREPSSCTCACRPHRAPTARPTSRTSRRRRRRSARVLAARGDRRQQVDRAGRLDPRRRAGARPQRRVRRVQPRVPPGGLGRPRLPPSRPNRDRRRRPGRRRSRSRRCTSGSQRRSSSPTRRRPRRSSTRATRSSRRRSASSTRSPPCAKPSAPT